jgi:hypothetical protein
MVYIASNTGVSYYNRPVFERPFFEAMVGGA